MDASKCFNASLNKRVGYLPSGGSRTRVWIGYTCETSDQGMADVFSERKRSSIMRSIRSSGNAETELRLVDILRRNRITGWRREHNVLGAPDFTFPKARVAVFVDGCFWHGCAKHWRLPKSNVTYWQSKIERNKARDRKVTRGLRAGGWEVVRLWNHSLDNEKGVVLRIERALKDKGL